ncbi:hypothetical protein NC651_006100 [Populus alba x Populus x berolinensis]|nr:hypothetical protein NC651_006100 [Populus alba x Populus x berolinensis]
MFFITLSVCSCCPHQLHPGTIVPVVVGANRRNVKDLLQSAIEVRSSLLGSLFFCFFFCSFDLLPSQKSPPRSNPSLGSHCFSPALHSLPFVKNIY